MVLSMSHLPKAKQTKITGANDHWRSLTSGIVQDFHSIFMQLVSQAKGINRRTARNRELQKETHGLVQLVQHGHDLINQICELTEPYHRKNSTFKLLTKLVAIANSMVPESVKILSEIPEQLPELAEDPVRVEKAVFNLLVNAWEAIEAEGTLTICADPVISAAEPCHTSVPIKAAKYVRISVADTGCGMTSDMRARACEPLFTTKHSSESAGLGLAEVARIMVENSGHIAIKSTPGKGSCFQLYFPVNQTGATQ